MSAVFSCPPVRRRLVKKSYVEPRFPVRHKFHDVTNTDPTQCQTPDRDTRTLSVPESSTPPPGSPVIGDNHTDSAPPTISTNPSSNRYSPFPHEGPDASTQSHGIDGIDQSVTGERTLPFSSPRPPSAGAHSDATNQMSDDELDRFIKECLSNDPIDIEWVQLRTDPALAEALVSYYTRGLSWWRECKKPVMSVYNPSRWLPSGTLASKELHRDLQTDTHGALNAVMTILSSRDGGESRSWFPKREKLRDEVKGICPIKDQQALYDMWATKKVEDDEQARNVMLSMMMETDSNVFESRRSDYINTIKTGHCPALTLDDGELATKLGSTICRNQVEASELYAHQRPASSVRPSCLSIAKSAVRTLRSEWKRGWGDGRSKTRPNSGSLFDLFVCINIA
jgi:hypothetical protein